MEVGAGPGIGDAGDLGQGPEHGGTESESGGMIGTVDGPGMDDAVSIDAFEAAISKALGLERETTMNEIDAMMDARERERGRQSMSAEIEAMMGARETGVDEATAASVRDTIESMGMFDDPANTDPVSPDSVPVGPTRSFQEQAMDDDYFEGQDPGRTLGAHPSRDIRIGMPMGVGRPTTTRDIENREVVDMYGRVAPIEDIEDPEERSLAYEMLGKLQKAAKEARTPLGKALNTIMGYGINAVPGMGQLNMIGKALKAGLAKAGFNVDPNIIGQAIRAAHEVSTQGPLGAGGTSIGARDDAFIEEFLRNIPASGYQEPWMKGLSERQIQYYLDRPSELEWVRNLYSQMNPSEDVAGQSGSETFVNDVTQTLMNGFKQTGIVWKPQSENDNNLVVLTPPGFDSANTSIENEAGDILDTGRNMGRTNGGRFTYRFSRPGAQYQGPIYLRIGNTRYKIDNPGARVN